MGYDTGMSETGARRALCPIAGAGGNPSSQAESPAVSGVAVRVRHLPDGQYDEARWLGLSGHDLEIDLLGQNLAVGALLEIERGQVLYWGELYRGSGSRALIRIENSLDLARLADERDAWE
jgi:hypothetical protein